MNAIIPANLGPISNRFAQLPVTDDLSSGIQSSFGLIGYKGKVWSIKYRGDETPLMRDDGDGAKNSIEGVILSASKHISKIWYELGYVEGSTAAPDCFSNNGITPEPTSAKPQHTSCALCPHNQWGSRITPAGKQGKSCADSKRLAIVPDGDLLNEAFGGPMLLRVPAASLQDLAMYGQKMQQMGYPYYAVVTKIAFDVNEAYPKFTFKAERGLTDDEADTVISLRDSHTVARILSENEFGGTPAAPDGGSAGQQNTTAAANPAAAASPTATSVGDQARAAAAANAANHGQQAQPTVAKVEPVKAVEPVTTQVTETPEQIEARIKAEIEQRIREEYAAKAAAVTPKVEETKVEEPTPAPAKATGFGKPKAATQQAATQQAAAPQETTVQDVQPGVATATDFENDLDAMLDNLLPSLT